MFEKLWLFIARSRCAREQSPLDMTDNGKFVYPKKTARRRGRKNCSFPNLLRKELSLSTARKQFAKQLSDVTSASAIENSPEAQFHTAALLAISDMRKEYDADLDFVCYGIGRISISDIARWQLAVWLRVIREVAAKRFFLHDPVLGPNEKSLVQELGFLLLETNHNSNLANMQMGLWSCDTTPTIFFMPHCPKGLYQNILWANWSAACLNRIVIIGNSFEGYADQLGQDKVNEEQIPTILALTAMPDVVQECPVLDTKSMKVKRSRDMQLGCRSLNDTKIQCFEVPEDSRLPERPGVIWPGFPREAFEQTKV